MGKRAERTCQGCTACCDGWVQMTISGEPVHPGRPCIHSTGHGCAIYDRRPEDPCRQFFCGWIIPDSPLPDWLHPEKGRVLVLFGKLRWQGLPVDVAVPVGKRIPPRSLHWLQAFAQRHNRPLLYAEQTLVDGEMQPEQTFFGYGPPAFQEWVKDKAARGERFW